MIPRMVLKTTILLILIPKYPSNQSLPQVSTNSRQAPGLLSLHATSHCASDIVSSFANLAGTYGRVEKCRLEGMIGILIILPAGSQRLCAIVVFMFFSTIPT